MEWFSSHSKYEFIDKQNEERQAERNFQNKFNSAFTALENKIHNAEISKSTDPVSKESAGSKAKKTGGKKQLKSVRISEPTITQNQPMPAGTKKEMILPTEFSEDVLDLYKRSNNDIEKIRASGHPLISK